MSRLSIRTFQLQTGVTGRALTAELQDQESGTRGYGQLPPKKRSEFVDVKISMLQFPRLYGLYDHTVSLHRP